MVKVSIISIVLAAAALEASAFAPAKAPFSHKITQLEAKNGDVTENVGKMFAVAALSLTMFMGPSPAFADGKYIKVSLYLSAIFLLYTLV
jgi:hypothetical protein